MRDFLYALCSTGNLKISIFVNGRKIETTGNQIHIISEDFIQCGQTNVSIIDIRSIDSIDFSKINANFIADFCGEKIDEEKAIMAMIAEATIRQPFMALSRKIEHNCRFISRSVYPKEQSIWRINLNLSVPAVQGIERKKDGNIHIGNFYKNDENWKWSGNIV